VIYSFSVSPNSIAEGDCVDINWSVGGGVSGSGGCNTYSAAYQVTGSNLNITSPLATGKLCDSDIDAQEQAFFAAMESAASFTIEAGQLYITGISGSVVLEYSATGP
jgi:heat shock protein HslJ